MTITLYENTFITLNDANTYFNNRPNSELWSNLSDTEKEQALIFATMKINNFNFVGNKLSASQPLEFPRNFDLPKEIQFAVCEEALAIIENSSHSKNKNYGISSVSIGNTSVSYFDKNNIGILISNYALNFVLKWTKKNYDVI